MVFDIVVILIKNPQRQAYLFRGRRGNGRQQQQAGEQQRAHG